MEVHSNGSVGNMQRSIWDDKVLYVVRVHMRQEMIRTSGYNAGSEAEISVKQNGPSGL
jgi:hypothetical protein